MAQLKKSFPPDIDYVIALDQTNAVTEGIREIVLTLGIALVLVIIVVYLFLQGWRATLIPLLAVPVSLVGTFAFFPLFGFSINTLSMFGMVLAIGLVVDDAIVVVEAVERHIEEGMAPKDAAAESHAGDFRACHRHCSGALGGIHTHGVHTGHYGTVVPAVRGHDRDFRDHLGIQRTQFEPGSLRAPASTEETQRGRCCESSSTGSIAFSDAQPTATCSVSRTLIRKSGLAVVALLRFRSGSRLLWREVAVQLPAG